MTDVQMTVVMPVGPSADPKFDPGFVEDTLKSIEYYAEPGWRLVLVDDSRSSLCRSLRTSGDVTVVEARVPGTLGGGYLNLSDGYLAALEKPFDIMLRIDTDGLVVGGGFEKLAADFFRANPRVGWLGNHSRDFDGTPCDRSWPKKQLLWHLTSQWRKTPAVSAKIAWLVLRASVHGYRLGESVLGGVCIFSRSSIETLANHRLLGDPQLGRCTLEEDHIFGLCMKACGLELANFGSAFDSLPVAARLKGLPASPDDLIAAGKSLVHSTRFWDDMDEAAVREVFAAQRT